MKKYKIGKGEESRMKAVMYNFHTWIPYRREEEFIVEVDKILKESGFTIIDKVEHFFGGQGYTGLWLLAESHFAIHTFPEENTIYIEISSCVKAYFDNFMKHFNVYCKEKEGYI